MEKTYNSYCLTFNSPLHVGDYKPNEYGTSMRHICSDTLQAALMAVRIQYGLSIPEDGDPGFAISSLFPFVKGDTSNVTYFLPKPVTGLSIPPGKEDWIKKIKKVAWIDTDYYSRLLAGKVITDYGGSGGAHIKGEFLSSALSGNIYRNPESDVVYESQVTQRVSLPRVQGSEQINNLFAMERLYFQDKAGLYFLFEGNEEKKEWLEQSLNLLAEEGIGTDRNLGHGTFTWKPGEVNIELPEDADHMVTIGLFHPENPQSLKTFIDDHSAWKLIKRGGWITDPRYQSIRKRSVYMFSEGSVFKKPENIKNQIGLPAINLQPRAEEGEYPVDHPIWRCGRSLVLPFKLN